MSDIPRKSLLRSNGFGSSGCWRENARRRWVSLAAPRTPCRAASRGRASGAVTAGSALASRRRMVSRLPRITVRRLLKSWATASCELSRPPPFFAPGEAWLRPLLFFWLHPVAERSGVFGSQATEIRDGGGGRQAANDKSQKNMDLPRFRGEAWCWVSVTDWRSGRRPPFRCSSLVRPQRSPFLHPGPYAGSAVARSPCQARAFCAPARACA